MGCTGSAEGGVGYIGCLKMVAFAIIFSLSINITIVFNKLGGIFPSNNVFST